MSKIFAIVSVAVLIPFLADAVWSDRVRHAEPISRIFYDVTFQISGSAKSPPTIILSSNGKKIFFSDCDGLKSFLCSDDKYWSGWHVARQVEVVEVAPKRGIIKSILINPYEGIPTKISNSKVSAWIIKNERMPWRRVYGLLIIFFTSIVLFFCLQYFQSKISEQE